MALTKLFLLSFSVICLAKFIKTDYVAAVVEYQSIINDTSSTKTVEDNLDQYVHYIEEARGKSVQIIVFPEYGLTGLVTDPSNYAIYIPDPGENKTFENYWLQILSNAAVAHEMYVAVNLLEKKNNNTIYYNTNVVFDKYGKIVAKYRKINLHEEPAITPGNPNQTQNVFTTDFGVTFGLFNCFDLIHSNQNKTILEKGVTDIISPNAWVSYLPFFHSLSIQSGYAAGSHVNLLAANFNNAEKGMGGSGIFGPNGTPFAFYISGEKGGMVIKIATVKNIPIQKHTLFTNFGFTGIEDVPTLDDYKTKIYFESEKYKFKTLNLLQSNIKEEICYKSFCCVFNINASSIFVNVSETYKIMAYKGTGKFGNLQLCSLLACESSDSSTCGTRNAKLTSRFDSILIEANVPNDSEQFYQPNSLTMDLVPVFNTIFTSTVSGDVRTFRSFASDLQQQNIVAFGLMGIKNNGVTLGLSSILFVVVMLFTYILH